MGQKELYPATRVIIGLLGMGSIVAASILMPGLPVALGAIQKAKRKYDYQKSIKEWKKFDQKLLRRNLRRLQKQKIIEITEKKGQEVIKLTQKGQTKYLGFKLEELSLKGRAWDGKWRLVIYDINKLKKIAQDNFRRILKQIKFLQLQKSVYLTPYKCKEEVEYLREYFDLAEEVIYLEVSKIENEKFYKDFFGV